MKDKRSKLSYWFMLSGLGIFGLGFIPAQANLLMPASAYLIITGIAIVLLSMCWSFAELFFPRPLENAVPDITETMIEAGTVFLMEEFPDAWTFSRGGISKREARLIVEGLLRAASAGHPSRISAADGD